MRVVGRYALYGAIAAGGMATVHLGRLLGPVGFSRTVAIKRLHAQFASDPEFVSMFLDEARLAARIRHPNVVPTLDVVATGGELFLVMDYVPGESVARLARALRERQQAIPVRILSAVMAGVLHGLHAAHEAKDERGHPLGIVHRDVSPQNVLVGVDGVPRVLDFGVAKAAGRVQTTKEGQIKGKIAYMPPEQLKGAAVSRQTDIYAAGVMIWELVTGQRLFSADNEGALVAKILDPKIEPPSRVVTITRRQTLDDRAMRQLEALDATILRALAMRPEDRFPTARAMALELERTCPPATASEVTDWLESVARDVLDSRAQMVAEIESSASLHAEGRDNHVMSVLHGERPTLGPGERTHLSSAPPAAPPTPTRAQSPQARNVVAQTLPLGVRGYQPESPPVTQPSSISVATGTQGQQTAQGSSKRAAVAAMTGILLGLGVLAGLSFVWKNAASKRAAARVTPEPAPSAEPAQSATAAPTVAVAETAASPLPPPTASAMATVSPPIDAGAPRIVTPARRSAPAATTKPPPPPPAPENDCATPYWYDAQGVKHYKPQCLGK